MYVQKELSIAYDEFFGETVKEYDKKQKRKDRIGDMTDSGCGTPEGKVCAEVLISML